MLSISTPGAVEAVERVKVLIKATIPTESSLLALYFWGSRWWGNSTSSSDWDFLAVVSDEYIQPPHHNVAEADDLDVAIMSLTNFHRMMEDHVPFILPFVFYPPSGIILQTLDFSSFRIQLPKLKKALLVNQDVNLKQARNIWRDGEIYRCKKRVFFVVQMIVLSKQIATCGKIHDFYEANSYYKQIVSQEWADWNQFSGFFLPLKEKLIDEFKALINKPMEWEANFTPDPGTTITQEYVSSRGLKLMHYELSIESLVHPKYNSLVHLRPSEEFTPWLSKLAVECNGMILEIPSDLQTSNSQNSSPPQTKQIFPIRCLGPPKLFNFLVTDTKSGEKLSKTQKPPKKQRSEQNSIYSDPELKFHEMLDGKHVSLFWFNGEWMISTTLTPCGDELVDCGGNLQDGKDKFEPSQLFDLPQKPENSEPSETPEKPQKSFSQQPQTEKHLSSGDQLVVASNQVTTRFCDLFWELWKNLNYELPHEDNAHDICFHFVVIHPKLKNLIFYHNSSITLVSAVNTKTLQQEDPGSLAKTFNWNFSQSLQITPQEIEEKLTKDHNFAGFIVEKNGKRSLLPSEIFSDLTKASALFETDLPQVEIILVQVITHHYFNPIIQHYPNNKLTATINQIRQKFDQLCQQVDLAYQEMSVITDFRQLVVSSKKFGKTIQPWVLVLRKHEFKTLLSFMISHHGTRRKVRKGIEHWWEHHHKTNIEKVHNPYK